MPIIFSRLINNSESNFEREYLEERLENLQNLYKLNKNFDLKLTIENISDSQKDDVLDSFIKDQDYTLLSPSDNIKQCKQVAKYLNIDVNIALCKLCWHINNFEFIFEVAKDIFVNGCDAETSCTISGLLLMNIGYSDMAFNGNMTEFKLDTTFQESPTSDSASFLSGLQLAANILIKTVKEDGTNQSICLQMLEWIEGSLCLSQELDSNFELFWKGIYITSRTLPTVIALNTVRNIFKMFLKNVGR